VNHSDDSTTAATPITFGGESVNQASRYSAGTITHAWMVPYR
jgi:hypothetical protein